jgi:hypothetical protein
MLGKHGTHHANSVAQEMHLVTQYFYIANLACTKTKMIEKPDGNEVVTINEGAFRSINVAEKPLLCMAHFIFGSSGLLM